MYDGRGKSGRTHATEGMAAKAGKARLNLEV